MFIYGFFLIDTLRNLSPLLMYTAMSQPSLFKRTPVPRVLFNALPFLPKQRTLKEFPTTIYKISVQSEGGGMDL